MSPLPSPYSELSGRFHTWGLLLPSLAASWPCSEGSNTDGTISISRLSCVRGSMAFWTWFLSSGKLPTFSLPSPPAFGVSGSLHSRPHSRLSSSLPFLFSSSFPPACCDSGVVRRSCSPCDAPRLHSLLNLGCGEMRGVRWWGAEGL